MNLIFDINTLYVVVVVRYCGVGLIPLIVIGATVLDSELFLKTEDFYFEKKVILELMDLWRYHLLGFFCGEQGLWM